MRKVYYVELITMHIRFPKHLTLQQSIETAWYCRDTTDLCSFDTYEDAYLHLLDIPVRSHKTLEGYVLYMTAICYFEHNEEDEDEDNLIDQYLLIRAQDPETEDEVIKFYDVSGREIDEYELDESFYSDKDRQPRERLQDCSEASEEIKTNKIQ